MAAPESDRRQSKRGRAAVSKSQNPKSPRRRTAKRNAGAVNGKQPDAPYRLPPTVSRKALLERGSDRRFRKLVSDLLIIAVRMQLIREHLGQGIGVSGPQYSLMIAVARMQDGDGVSVSAVAETQHVSRAFVASETGKLERRGLLVKRTNPSDRRGVLLSLSRAGWLTIDRFGPEIRAINDRLFGSFKAESFVAACAAAQALVAGSAEALRYARTRPAKPRSRGRV